MQISKYANFDSEYVNLWNDYVNTTEGDGNIHEQICNVYYLQGYYSANINKICFYPKNLAKLAVQNLFMKRLADMGE